MPRWPIKKVPSQVVTKTKVIDGEKRGRGRPRKISVVRPRGGGRPRKITQSGSELAPVVRPRGRPRKITQLKSGLAPVVRSRGRPRKITPMDSRLEAVRRVVLGSPSPSPGPSRAVEVVSGDSGPVRVEERKVKRLRRRFPGAPNHVGKRLKIVAPAVEKVVRKQPRVDTPAPLPLKGGRGKTRTVRSVRGVAQAASSPTAGRSSAVENRVGKELNNKVKNKEKFLAPENQQKSARIRRGKKVDRPAALPLKGGKGKPQSLPEPEVEVSGSDEDDASPLEVESGSDSERRKQRMLQRAREFHTFKRNQLTNYLVHLLCRNYIKKNFPDAVPLC